MRANLIYLAILASACGHEEEPAEPARVRECACGIRDIEEGEWRQLPLSESEVQALVPTRGEAGIRSCLESGRALVESAQVLVRPTGAVGLLDCNLREFGISYRMRVEAELTATAADASAPARFHIQFSEGTIDVEDPYDDELRPLIHLRATVTMAELRDQPGAEPLLALVACAYERILADRPDFPIDERTFVAQLDASLGPRRVGESSEIFGLRVTLGGDWEASYFACSDWIKGPVYQSLEPKNILAHSCDRSCTKR